jgi:transposase-like protein
MEFEKSFQSEKQCLEYLINTKWPDGFSCAECGTKNYWHLSRKRIKCSQCGQVITVTAGTLFDQSNKPLTLWFRAIWWMIGQKTGVSAKGLQKILGIGSYKTAWFWLHKLRVLMVLPERTKLSGKVEIDETYVGGKKQGKRGRGSENKKAVIVAIEVLPIGTGRVRLKKIDSVKRKNLSEFVKANVEPGTMVVTDGYTGYLFLENEGYAHTVNKQVVATEEEEMLPNIHRVASLLKRWLIGTHQNYSSEERLQSYLDEFSFRYNRRKSKSRGLLFHRIVDHAMVHQPILYESIREVSIKPKKKSSGKK